MKGIQYGPRGASYGHLGKRFGGKHNGKTPAKYKTTPLFKRLHIISYKKRFGLAMTIRFFYGVVQPKSKRKQIGKEIKRYCKNEKKIIYDSVKKAGLDRRRCTGDRTNTVFSQSEEKAIYDLFRTAYDRMLPINGRDIIGWAWTIAQKVGKEKVFKGGRGWLRGFCSRWGLSIQVM